LEAIKSVRKHKKRVLLVANRYRSWYNRAGAAILLSAVSDGLQVQS
jgi:hypothetical protein